MIYPQTLTLQQLEQEHPQFTEAKECYQTLDLLIQGGYRLEKAAANFIKKRSGEPREVYESRLKKFTYASPLADAILEHLNKINEGQLVVELPKRSNGEVIDSADWSRFRESTNGKGRTEKALIKKLLRELLLYKKVYIQIDREAAPDGLVIESVADESLLRSRVPRANIYTANQVPLWSESSDGTLNWVKLRCVEYQTNPFGETDILIRWTFIDKETIAVYEAVASSFDESGKVRSLKVEDSSTVGGLPTDSSNIRLNKIIQHGFGRIPLIKIECDDDLWLGNQCYLKAKEHLVLSCQNFDLLSFAYVQRTMKPTIRQLDYAAPMEDVTSVPPGFETGNYNVLSVDDFSFKEMQGAIVPHLASALSDIKSEIHSLCKLGGTVVSSANKSVVSQSGISKIMDFHKQEMLLKECGVIITDAYQDVLQLVALVLSVPPEEVSVSGLNKFNLNQIEDIITIMGQDPVWNKLVPQVRKIVLTQFYDLLISNTTPEQKEEIDKQIDELLNKSVAEIQVS